MNFRLLCSMVVICLSALAGVVQANCNFGISSSTIDGNMPRPDAKYDLQSNMVSNKDGAFLIRRSAHGLHLFRLTTKTGEFLESPEYIDRLAGLSDKNGWDQEKYRWGVKTVASDHEIFVVSHGYHGLSIDAIVTSDAAPKWFPLRTTYQPWGHEEFIEDAWAGDASVYESLKVTYADGKLFAMLRTRDRGVEVFMLPIYHFKELDSKPGSGIARQYYWRWFQIGGPLDQYANLSPDGSENPLAKDPAVYRNLALLPFRFGARAKERGITVASLGENGIKTHSIHYKALYLENGEIDHLTVSENWTDNAHVQTKIKDHAENWNKAAYYSSFQAVSAGLQDHYFFLRGPTGMHAHHLSTEGVVLADNLVPALDPSSKKILRDRPTQAVVDALPQAQADHFNDSLDGCVPWQEAPYAQLIRAHVGRDIATNDRAILLAAFTDAGPIHWQYFHDPEQPETNVFAPQWKENEREFSRTPAHLQKFLQLQAFDPIEFKDSPRGLRSTAIADKMLFSSDVHSQWGAVHENLIDGFLMLASVEASVIEPEMHVWPRRKVPVRTAVSQITFDSLKNALPSGFADDAEILDSEVKGWAERFSDREESDDHVQGIGMTIDGRFVASVELDDTCSVLLWSNRFNPARDDEDDLRWQYDCALAGDHPFAVAVAGEFVGVGTDDGTVLFQFHSNGLVEPFTLRDHTGDKVPALEALAVGVNKQENKFIIMGGPVQKGLQGEFPVTFYSQDLDEQGRLSCTINHVCVFQKHEMEIDVRISQGGMSLIDIPDSSNMVLIAPYADSLVVAGTQYDEAMYMSELDFSTFPPKVVYSIQERDLGDTQASLTIWEVPSARFGASVAQLENGDLYMIWSGALVTIDHTDEEYEIGIRKINVK